MVSNLEQIAYAFGFASFNASLHSLRIHVNQGNVSPDEVEKILDSLVEILENNLPEDVREMTIAGYDPHFAEMRNVAKANWKN